MSSRSIQIVGGPGREEAHVDGTKNALKVTGDVTLNAGGAPQEVVQSDPDLLRANANMQVGDADVSDSNPVPVKAPNPLDVQPAAGGCFPVDNCPGTDMDVRIAAQDIDVKTTEGRIVSTGNSSTTPLGSSATFTGTAQDVSGYHSVQVQVFADQISGNSGNGLVIQWSPDGTNWDLSQSFEVLDNMGRSITLPVRGRFVRVVYTNGATAQTVFRLQTMLNPKPSAVELSVDGKTVTATGGGGSEMVGLPVDIIQASTTVPVSDDADQDLGTPPNNTDKAKMAGAVRDEKLSIPFIGASDGGLEIPRLDDRGATWVVNADSYNERVKLGKLFTFSFPFSVPAAGSVDLRIDGSGNQRYRMRIRVGVLGLNDALIEVYENTTFSATGSSVTGVSRNRSSGITAPATPKFDTGATVSAVGTLLLQTIAVATEMVRLDELLMDPTVPASTDALIRISDPIGSGLGGVLNVDYYLDAGA